MTFTQRQLPLGRWNWQRSRPWLSLHFVTFYNISPLFSFILSMWLFYIINYFNFCSTIWKWNTSWVQRLIILWTLMCSKGGGRPPLPSTTGKYQLTSANYLTFKRVQVKFTAIFIFLTWLRIGWWDIGISCVKPRWQKKTKRHHDVISSFQTKY